MSVFLKSNPVGMDLYIQRLQNHLYVKLLPKLPNGTVWNSFGKCNRIFESNAYKARLIGNNGEETDVLWDDRCSMVSFFGHDTILYNETRQKVNAHFIVMCNLKTLFPGVTDHRTEDSIKNLFMNYIGEALFNFHYVSMETGTENVFKEYKGNIPSMRSADNAPVFCFRINFFIHYNPNFTTTLKIR